MLRDAILNTIQALTKKATIGMTSIMRKSFASPINPNGIITKTGFNITERGDIITVSTEFPDYAYWANRGRGPGKMPPDAPIRDWVKRHNIAEDAVFPIRRRMAEEGSKRFRDNNPVNFTEPLRRMLELMNKTLRVVSVEYTKNELYPWAKELESESVNVKI